MTMKRLLALLLLSAPAWGAWSYYYPLTYDHTLVGGSDSSNFTALVYFSAAAMKDTGHGGDVQSSAGADIEFFSDTGLYHANRQRAWSFTTTVNGIGWFWVKIGTLSHTANGTIYMCVGNGSPPARTANPWDTYSRRIWHSPERVLAYRPGLQRQRLQRHEPQTRRAGRRPKSTERQASVRRLCRFRGVVASPTCTRPASHGFGVDQPVVLDGRWNAPSSPTRDHGAPYADFDFRKTPAARNGVALIPGGVNVSQAGSARYHNRKLATRDRFTYDGGHLIVYTNGGECGQFRRYRS